MFKAGDVIDTRYRVTGICSESGGMGSVLFVQRLGTTSRQLVLKYCKLTSEEAIKRFKREVRLMRGFEGNEKIVQISDSNLEYAPPYFVMDHYEGGDLTSKIENLRDNPQYQEEVFDAMIRCIEELHRSEIFHRDIKPQNFLIKDDIISVSDFGLSTELDSSTMFTRASQHWGTPGYLPPEYQSTGGFRDPSAASDIFMLGKTFYHLLTGKQVIYMVQGDIPSSLWLVIDKCCSLDKQRRYQDLGALRRAMTNAYDIVLERTNGSASAFRNFRDIKVRLDTTGGYSVESVKNFIDQLSSLDNSAKAELCKEAPYEFFVALSQGELNSHVRDFLSAYKLMVNKTDYHWGYAETIAKNMKTMFLGDDLYLSDRAEALGLAITAAHSQNRFVAMDICRGLVKNVTDDSLAIHVAAMIDDHSDTFIADVAPLECKAAAIRVALSNIKKTTS